MLKLTHGSKEQKGVSADGTAVLAAPLALVAYPSMQDAHPVISGGCTRFRDAMRTPVKGFRNDFRARAPYWRAGFFLSAARYGRRTVAFSPLSDGSKACNSYRTCKNCPE